MLAVNEMDAKTKKNTVRTTIYLPENLHAEIRMEAIRRRISMTQLITQAIQSYLPNINKGISK
jgi:hypothetical protein